MADSAKLLIVEHLPYDLQLWSNLEDLWLLADVAVAAPIADHGVAVGQALNARHEAERLAGQVVFIDPPDDFIVWIDLDQLVAVAAADQRVAIGKPQGFVGIAGHFDAADFPSLSVVFPHHVFARQRHEVRAGERFADDPHLQVGALGGGRDLEFFADLPLAIDFDQPGAPHSPMSTRPSGRGWQV